MKKSMIAFCAAACLLVQPAISHAAETSNGGQNVVEKRTVYINSFNTQIDIKTMLEKVEVLNQPSTTKQVVVFNQQALPKAVEKKEATKPSTKKEQALPKAVEKKETTKPSTKKEQTAPKAVEKKEATKQPTTTQQTTPKSEEKVVTQPTTTQPTQPTETTQQETTPVQQNLTEVDQIEAAVVELTNKERAKAGLAPLQMDTALMAAAREKSQDMKNNNYFSHTSPTFGSPFDRLKALGISYQAAGENIAKGQRTAEEVVTAWMNSEGHRANILNGNYTHIGVGFVQDGYIWTQQFIKK